MISIAHMSKSDMELIGKGIKPAGLLFIGEYSYVFNHLIHWGNWAELGFSRTFYNNVRRVLNQGFDRVELDRDADRVAGLPAFDW